MIKDYKQLITINIKLLSGQHSLSTIYFDWVHLMAYSISNSVDKQQAIEREDAYMRIINKYSKDEAQKFTECFSLLVLALEFQPKDWLGELYMDLELGNEVTGQFFTPFHISQLMAELTFSKNELILEKKNWIGYYEPCCGAGSMPIAFALTMQKHHYNYQKQLVVWCEDIDENCLLMTYIQLSLLGIKAICTVKNSLSQKEFSTWYTPFYLCFPPSKEIVKERISRSKVNAVKNTPLNGAEQLVLF